MLPNVARTASQVGNALRAVLTRTASGVGTDLRAVRHRRHGAVGDIALPPELAGPRPARSKPLVPDPNSLPGRDRAPSAPDSNSLPGRDRSPSGPAPQTWRFQRNRPTHEAALRMPSRVSQLNRSSSETSGLVAEGDCNVTPTPNPAFLRTAAGCAARHSSALGPKHGFPTLHSMASICPGRPPGSRRSSCWAHLRAGGRL